jgi:hypothetical protein
MMKYTHLHTQDLSLEIFLVMVWQANDMIHSGRIERQSNSLYHSNNFAIGSPHQMLAKT